MASDAFPTPAPLPSSAPPEPRKYTSEQEGMLADLIAHLEQSDYALPTTLKQFNSFKKARPLRRPVQSGSASSVKGLKALENMKLQPLTDREKCWLSKEQLLRYLRAVKWKWDAAALRTEEAIVWRRDYGVETLTADMVEMEGKTGKEVILGFDNNGRPLQHMYPYRQNTKVSPRQIQYTVWYLERCIDLMAPGVENLCLAIDFGADLPGAGGQPTSLGQARIVLHILQTYYAERLGRAICVNVPMLFFAFYKLVGPWVDPVTKEKIVFTREKVEARKFVPPEQLEKDRFGGELEFTYDHETYFPALDKLCKQRREKTFENWQKMAHGRIGFSEQLTRPPFEAVPSETSPERADSIASKDGAVAVAIPPAAPSSMMS